MKKLLALCLTVVLCLCCLASCSSAHKENTWFSEEKLTECLVGDLPTITKDYVKHVDEDIYVSFTNKERESYVVSVFEYLKSQDFKYLGTRGAQVSTLAGAFTTYYFEPATELSDFYVEGAYRFVYSDSTLDDSDKPIFCIIAIYEYEAKNLEYGTKNFAYNTLITLDYKSEAPMGGFYVLKEEEHEHTITYVSAGESGHFENYTCGCPHDHGAVPHYDENGDYICDACGYEYGECNHQWDDGVEIEGGLGAYVMEYTCLLCGIREREAITIIPPSGESHSISYQSDRTRELLMEGFAPTEAKPGDTVVLRTYPIMDADLAFYANGVKLTQTHADSDYWEYIFTMPDEDVVITHEITDGFLPD